MAKPVEKDLSPRERFVKLANGRVNKVLEGMTSVARLNSPSYEYTEDDVVKIIDAMQEKLDNTKAVLLKEATVSAGFSVE